MDALSPQTVPYSKKAAKTLGAFQITCGLCCILLQIGEIVFFTTYINISPYDTPGIWPGIWFTIAGSFAVSSSKGEPSKCKIIATMVLSIIACVFCWAPVIPQAALLCVGSAWFSAFFPILGTVRSVVCGLIIMFAIVEFGVALAQSIVCCKVVCQCCGAPAETTTTHIVTYTTQPVGGVPGQVPPPYQK